jgi:pyruvyltransferase
MRMVKIAWQKFNESKSNRMIYLKHFTRFPNIGDRFSLILAEKIFDQKIITCNEASLPSKNLVMIGSIIHWADNQSIVCGSGLIAEHIGLKHKPSKIFCVRGPLTAEKIRKLGIECSNKFADPGVLAAKIYPGNDKIKHQIGLVPHYWDFSNDYTEFCRSKGVQILNVQDEPSVFFQQLRECEIILSSSLHGLIFAHSFGKPALWIEVSDKVIGNGFKFYDYYSSLGVAPGNVKRFTVKQGQFPDPHQLSDIASYINQQVLISNVEEALSQTRLELGCM